MVMQRPLCVILTSLNRQFTTILTTFRNQLILTGTVSSGKFLYWGKHMFKSRHLLGEAGQICETAAKFGR